MKRQQDAEHEESSVGLIDSKEPGNRAKQEAMEIAEEAREKESRIPSFAGLLFMGKFASDLMHPFPKQSEEDKKAGDAFIARVESYLEKELDPNEVDRTREIPRPVIEELGRMGLFAMKVPKEYNGLGFTITNYNRVIMKVCSYCASTGVLLSAHQSIGVPQPLKMFGTEAQKRKFLPLFREGKISAFALTEPEVGSDPAQMSSQAVLSEDGSHYVLNGSKLWCTNGTVADVIVVMANTAPKIVRGKEKKQISAFILEMNTPGVQVVQRCEFMGLSGIYNGMLNFTNVKIPVENRIGDEGRGLAMALATINVGRLTLPAGCLGAAKQCLSIARRWGKERVQWGLPVGLHEEGRQKVAYIAATTFAMEAITYLTSAWGDRGDADIRIEGSMAKLFCTESTWKIIDMTMQLRGGRGYEKASSLMARGEPGYPIERAMRDCRINMILEGSTEIMHLFLAREAMDPHLKNVKELLTGKLSFFQKLGKVLKLLGHYSVWYPSQWLRSLKSSSYREMGDLEEYFQYCEKMSHQLARLIFYNMARYRQKLEKKQLLLARLMEIGTELFAMAATCAYAQSLQKDKMGDKAPIKLADHFCRLAKRRIEAHLHALNHNDDRSGNQLAKEIVEGEMKWLEEGIMWIGPKN